MATAAETFSRLKGFRRFSRNGAHENAVSPSAPEDSVEVETPPTQPKTSTAQENLLAKLREDRALKRAKPDAVFGEAFPLLDAFGKVIDQYTDDDWNKVRARDRAFTPSDRAVLRPIDDFAQGIPLPDVVDPEWRKPLVHVVYDAFSETAGNLYDRSYNNKYGKTPGWFGVGLDAGRAALEILDAGNPNREPVILPLFHMPSGEQMTVEALRG